MRALFEPSLPNECSSKPAWLPQAGPLHPNTAILFHVPNSIPFSQL